MSFNLNLSRKSGFQVIDPAIPVIIRDSKGIPFYDTTDLLPRVQRFNLPAGSYLVDTEENIADLPYTVKYRHILMPAIQRTYPSPVNFEIKYGDNPNKCSILWDQGIIFFDSSFQNRPLPEVDFILGHEFGHQFYGGFDKETQPDKYDRAEMYCDWFSANRMNRIGYNPSQIGLAPIDSLSDRSDYRKNAIVQKLTQ